VAIVSYVAPVSPFLIDKARLMTHNTGRTSLHPRRSTEVVHNYDVASPNFVLPGHEQYQAGAAGLAHTRSLEFLKKHLGGPQFNLEDIWDEHTLFEFRERDVAKTMSTMVEEPYVNHVPTVCLPYFISTRTSPEIHTL
jgi:carboxymethylenebutenolidase